MIGWMTAAELAALSHRPVGTIYWLASRDSWARTPPPARPVLYSTADAGKSLASLVPLDT